MLPYDVDRKVGHVSFAPQPARILPSNPPAEVRAEVGHERLHRIEEAPLPGLFEADVPTRQLDVKLREMLRSPCLLALDRQPPEASREILRRTLLADRRTLPECG